jgi:hypothetical protein
LQFQDRQKKAEADGLWNLRRRKMNSYVIRIYRRNLHSLHEVTGIVENTLTSRQTSFVGMDGLQSVLADFIGTAPLDHADPSQGDMYGYDEAVANA